MTSPYLIRPLRTLEQALAERLRRPVPVRSRRKPAADSAPANPDEAPVKAAKSAEGGGD